MNGQRKISLTEIIEESIKNIGHRELVTLY